jgi:hypothetical protein
MDGLFGGINRGIRVQPGPHIQEAQVLSQFYGREYGGGKQGKFMASGSQPPDLGSEGGEKGAVHPVAAKFRLGVAVQVEHIFAPQKVRTPGRADKYPQDKEKGGLAGTGRPHYRHDLAGIDPQIDIPEHIDVTGVGLVAFGEIGHLD